MLFTLCFACRCIKLDNPKIKDKVMSLPGAQEVLLLAGFVRGR